MQIPVGAGPAASPLYDIDPGFAKDFKDLGCDLVTLAASALSIESVAHASRESLRNAGSVVKDSALGAFSAYCTVVSFSKCMTSGLFSTDALSTLAHGLNATALMDRAVQTRIGTGMGAGNYQAVTAGLVTTATLISRAYQGDVPGVMLSGGKLAASIACSGDSKAQQLLIAADMVYSNLRWLPTGT